MSGLNKAAIFIILIATAYVAFEGCNSASALDTVKKLPTIPAPALPMGYVRL